MIRCPYCKGKARATYIRIGQVFTSTGGLNYCSKCDVILKKANVTFVNKKGEHKLE